MPAERAAARAHGSPRRSVVPSGGRSLWFAAAWTGLAPAVIGGFIAIAAVAFCWLPASGGNGNADSVIRAGVLTFLTALHGGITVDGVPAEFVPLGMSAAVALLAWRAGTGLADAAGDHERLPASRLVQAAIAQAVVFSAACAVAARLATLGTSEVSPLAAASSALVLFACTGTVAFIRASGLIGDRLATVLPAVRGAVAAVSVYLGLGALLVAASLIMHGERVRFLSQQVGGGWSGAPVLLLGLLAAPNAAVAGASYLAGPGFAVGGGSHVALWSTAHGTLPAFPLLGAVPAGPAVTVTWVLAALAPLAAGVAVMRIVRGAAAPWLSMAGAVLGAGVLGLALAWLGGGAIGSGRLSAIGASPWQFGLALSAEVAAVGGASLGLVVLVARWRRTDEQPARPALVALCGGAPADEGESSDQLAG